MPFAQILAKNFHLSISSAMPIRPTICDDQAFQNLTIGISDPELARNDKSMREARREGASCHGHRVDPGRRAWPSPRRPRALAPKVSSLTGRDADKGAAAAAEVERSGAPALFVAADLEQPDAPDLIFDAALKRFGHVDGLVNSAALTDRGSLVDADMKFWDRLFAVNARAPFFLMQRLVNHLRERKAPGSIVNILSVHARGGAPELAVYASSKSALGRADQEHRARASLRSHPRQWNHSGLGRFARRAADAGGHARQRRGMAARRPPQACRSAAC